ncbi:MAG TPA: carbohydrate ABC transporter permease, partial [Candidatus Limnocylindrales bacterium]|nr:carbohydrate ABC transporter permease [Candidatus Limnocylindrales bacterium]
MTARSDTGPSGASGSSNLPGWVRRLPLHLFVIGLMIVWLIPTIGLFVNSFRSQTESTSSGWWTALFPPELFSVDNYAYVLGRNGIGNAFLNSLFIAVPSTVIPIFVAAFAAYAFAWMRFPGRYLLFIGVVGLLVVPLQTTFIPIQKLFATFGLNGELAAVWLAHTGYGLPFAIYLLRNFMAELPREVFESADIDGAGWATKFFRLVLPMTIPALAALAIFQFLFTWNDLLVALVYIGVNTDNQPMTIVVANLVQSTGGGMQYLAAAAFLTMALPLVVFLALQRYFVRGL